VLVSLPLPRRRRGTTPLLVIHPGFAKTATTTLQQGVFARHGQVHYLGIPAPDPALDRLIRRLPREDSTRFDVAAARAVLAPHLALPAGRRVAVLSYENFTLYESKDKGLIAARLRELCGPACRVMFTLRRQEDLLASWYLQKMRKYGRDRHHLTLKQYFRIKAREPSRSILGDLDYDATVGCYERLFGRESVGIFCHEQLRADPPGFARAVAAFLGVDAAELERLLRGAHLNAAETQRRLRVAQVTARYLPRALVHRGLELLPHALHRRLSRYVDAGPRAKVELPEIARRWIGEHCREGNRRLDVRHGGALARHGYTL
jgi:hypothetical protein